MLHSIGKCAKYVRLALEAAGIVTTGRPSAAGNYGPFLQQKGFNPVSIQQRCTRTVTSKDTMGTSGYLIFDNEA
jgi:hypothetical protein